MSIKTSVFSLNSGTLELIEQKFSEKRQIAKARERELFNIFDEDISEEEKWALKFLFAYMPLNDLADYDGPLFLSHVRRTLEIRRQVPWGELVPDHIFLHFVLPLRVNSENIEDCRGILFDELEERVMHLSMEDAILETNYWCHEKATYIGSDMRTISPLTMLCSAQGRCGEESTFAVSALRSIGIPARQCYTPRWAHCDSNHAWVEAWANGKWNFIGACEPEARLNQGWFSSPARRAMLINTRVHANYPGPEAVTLAHDWFTEINLLDGYAPAKTITIEVKDEDGRPIHGADVLFQLYNSAEFTPIATMPTDDDGRVSFKTGFGDLLIRAVQEGWWGEKKITVAERDHFEIVINRREQPEGTEDLDMVPPPVREEDAASPISEEQTQQHNNRVQEGVLIRKNYVESFIDEVQASELAKSLGLPEGRVWSILSKARGNSGEIAAFLLERSSEFGEWPLRLLESLNDKDLLDILRPTLDDHLISSLLWAEEHDEDLFTRYILCPRVLLEMIGPYKRSFQEAFTEAESARFRAEPSELVHWIAGNWETRDELTNLQGKATPMGSFRLKKGDRISLDIMFVAICRSLGIPARLHPNHQRPQFMVDKEWKDADFVKGREVQRDRGMIKLLREAETGEEAPTASYSENFTLARLENGDYHTLSYPYGKTDVYDEPFEVDQGAYRLTTGTRLKDGTALVRLVYFTVRAGEQTELPLAFRAAPLDIPVLGIRDRSCKFADTDGTVKRLDELAGIDGALVAWIEPEREPSKHLIREITELAESFSAIGAPIVFVLGDDQWTASFDPANYRGLPAGTEFVRDAAYESLSRFTAELRLSMTGFPHVFVLDGQDQIRYAMSGYKLGTGREALQILGKVLKR